MVALAAGRPAVNRAIGSRHVFSPSFDRYYKCNEPLHGRQNSAGLLPSTDAGCRLTGCLWQVSTSLAVPARLSQTIAGASRSPP